MSNAELRQIEKKVTIWDAGDGDDAPYDRYLVSFPDGACYTISPDGNICQYSGYNVKPQETYVRVDKVPYAVKKAIFNLLL